MRPTLWSWETGTGRAGVPPRRFETLFKPPDEHTPGTMHCELLRHGVPVLAHLDGCPTHRPPQLHSEFSEQRTPKSFGLPLVHTASSCRLSVAEALCCRVVGLDWSRVALRVSLVWFRTRAASELRLS